MEDALEKKKLSLKQQTKEEKLLKEPERWD